MFGPNHHLAGEPRRQREALAVGVVTLLLFITLASPTVAQVPPPPPPPNVLLILLDDAGIENFLAYNLRGVQGPYATTQRFDLLVDQGTLFTNAWSNTLCSPTRTGLHSGRHAFRTGIGDIINDDTVKGLDVFDPNLLPQLLADDVGGTETPYATGLFGKWHLGTAPAQGSTSAPLNAGYQNMAALFLDQQGVPEDQFSDRDWPFFHFILTTDGIPDPFNAEFDAMIADQDPMNDEESIYNTHEYTTRAIDWINARELEGATWFAYVPYLAPHGPWGCPRSGPESPYPGVNFGCDDSDDDEDFRGMIQAIDIEISRLLDGIGWDPAETLLIIASDNGTPSRLNTDPFDSNKAKGTTGQGGVWVPLLIVGPDVRGQVTVNDPVNLNDLYPTILDFAGRTIPGGVDSMSLKELLVNGDPIDPQEREFNYTEGFSPNFEPVADPQQDQFGPCRGSQAVMENPSKYPDATYKYVRLFGSSQEALYDIDIDPFEATNLLNTQLDQDQLQRLQDLEEHIDFTLKSDLASLCRGKLPTGTFCTSNDQCCSGVCGASGCVCPMP